MDCQKLIIINSNEKLQTKQQMEQIETSQKHIRYLLFLNCFMFVAHMHNEDADLYYFCQLTVIGQTFVVLNFYLSLFLHHKKYKLKTQLLLSRLHLVTIGLECIIVIGFWSLRIFFPMGILVEGEQRTIWMQALSFYMHGGSLITMLYFIKKDQIITETIKRKKVVFHLIWALPFAVIQYLRWHFTGQHVYGFIKHFTWFQLIAFQLTLFSLAVYFDYVISIRHGFRLLKNLEEKGSRRKIQVKFD